MWGGNQSNKLTLLDLCLVVLKRQTDGLLISLCVTEPQCELRTSSWHLDPCGPAARASFSRPSTFNLSWSVSLSPIQENQQKLRQLCCEAPLLAGHMKVNGTWNEFSFSHREVESRSYHLAIIHLILFIAVWSLSACLEATVSSDWASDLTTYLVTKSFLKIWCSVLSETLTCAQVYLIETKISFMSLPSKFFVFNQILNSHICLGLYLWLQRSELLICPLPTCW